MIIFLIPTMAMSAAADALTAPVLSYQDIGAEYSNFSFCIYMSERFHGEESEYHGFHQAP